MSHGSWGGVDRREKIRQRFARWDLLVFMEVFLVKQTLRAAKNARHEAVGRFVPVPTVGARRTSFEG
jgi:hypothetical protein